MTTAEFIVKAVQRHSDTFEYDEVEYVNAITKIRIRCKRHGIFEQTPNSHLTGSGCMKCRMENSGYSQRLNTEKFITKSLTVHKENIYDYSEVDYKNNHTKVKITCKQHGAFWQNPDAHMAGRGCDKCARLLQASQKLSNTPAFIEAANAQHGDGLYDYSLVDYVSAKTKVEIICPRGHSNFMQTPDSHLHGQGCPKCAKYGYNSSLSVNLYVLKCGNITKIGITNRDVQTRLDEISRRSGKDFHLKVFISFQDGAIPQKIETDLLRELSQMYIKPDETFDGSTECFIDLHYEDLLLKISSACNNYLPTYNQESK